jgi:hypothetical protein
VIDTPTINKKKGAMRSVNEMPHQWVCERGLNTSSSFPGKFTKIMAATVKPRNASNESNLFLAIFFLRSKFYIQNKKKLNKPAYEAKKTIIMAYKKSKLFSFLVYTYHI